jgi:hypothetical protein
VNVSGISVAHLLSSTLTREAFAFRHLIGADDVAQRWRDVFGDVIDANAVRQSHQRARQGGVLLNVDLFAVRELRFHLLGKDGASGKAANELQAAFAAVLGTALVENDGGSDVGSDMEWGAGIAWTAGQALAMAAVEFVPQSERVVYGDKILGLIRRRGTMKVRDIQMFIRGSLRSAEIKDLLGQLVEAGAIEWTAEGYRAVKNR